MEQVLIHLLLFFIQTYLAVESAAGTFFPVLNSSAVLLPAGEILT